MGPAEHARFQGARGNTWTASLPLSPSDQQALLEGRLTPVCDIARRYAADLARTRGQATP